MDEKFSWGSLKLHFWEKVIGRICWNSTSSWTKGSIHPAWILAFEKAGRILGSCWKSPAIITGTSPNCDEIWRAWSKVGHLIQYGHHCSDLHNHIWRNKVLWFLGWPESTRLQLWLFAIIFPKAQIGPYQQWKEWLSFGGTNSRTTMRCAKNAIFVRFLIYSFAVVRMRPMDSAWKFCESKLVWLRRVSWRKIASHDHCVHDGRVLTNQHLRYGKSNWWDLLLEIQVLDWSPCESQRQCMAESRGWFRKICDAVHTWVQ